MKKYSVSIHAPHAGRDAHETYLKWREMGFNPRAPCGARLAQLAEGYKTASVSIHAPHAGRDTTHVGVRVRVSVSIHAPHAGRDQGECAL